jgi:hypothetical protein
VQKPKMYCLGKVLSKKFVLTQGPPPEFRRYKKIIEDFTWEKAGRWGGGGGKGDQVILFSKFPNFFPKVSSGVCEDRMDAILLTSESTSMARIGQRYEAKNI